MPRSGWSILLCQSIREYQKAIEEQVIFWIMVAACCSADLCPSDLSCYQTGHDIGK